MRKESKFCWIPVCLISQRLFINSFGLFFSSLLASGSDDQHAIIWDPFRHKKLITMHTGHAANIFSVKVKSTSRFCFFSQHLVNMPKCVFLMIVRVCSSSLTPKTESWSQEPPIPRSTCTTWRRRRPFTCSQTTLTASNGSRRLPCGPTPSGARLRMASLGRSSWCLCLRRAWVCELRKAYKCME